MSIFSFSKLLNSGPSAHETVLLENFKQQNCDDFYKTIDIIGAGAEGNVYKAQRLCDGQIVAIKKLNLISDPQEAAIIMLHSSKILDSPYVLKYMETFYEQAKDSDDIQICIVMEYFVW